MNKEFFNNIITIASTVEEQDLYLPMHFNNGSLMESIKDANQKNLLAFIYCNPHGKEVKIKPAADGKFKNCIDVVLPMHESYETLANKTFETIRFFVKNYDFEYIYKGDITKDIDAYHLGLNQDAKQRKDFLGVSAERPRQNRRGFWYHEGIAPVLHPCARRTFARWAKKRDLFVDPWMFDEQVYFSGWKPYGLSHRFAKLVSDHGENYVDIYCKYLAGCEDHMIGKIWKDFSIAFGLEMR